MLARAGGDRPAVAAALGERSAGVLAEARMHVPVEVAPTGPASWPASWAPTAASRSAAGRPSGWARRSRSSTGCRSIAVPTTYAGSEMTPVWGLTEDGQKRTGRDPRVLPRSVIYDPELTLTLPVGDVGDQRDQRRRARRRGALRPDATPIISLMAEEGTRALAAALPRSSPTAPTSTPAAAGPVRRLVVRGGAWARPRCRCTTSSATPSAARWTCRTRRPTPSSCRTRWPTTSRPRRTRSRRCPARWAARPDPGAALWELAGRLGAPRSLRELGMAEADIPRIVEQVAGQPLRQPRPGDRGRPDPAAARGLGGRPAGRVSRWGGQPLFS